MSHFTKIKTKLRKRDRALNAVKASAERTYKGFQSVNRRDH
jgi:hypothetical protein